MITDIHDFVHSCIKIKTKKHFSNQFFSVHVKLSTMSNAYTING